MSEFSLKLSDDQIGLQSWVHGFAEDVVRPAAEEWDEKEEFPYPIVQQAAEIGGARDERHEHALGVKRVDLTHAEFHVSFGVIVAVEIVDGGNRSASFFLPR